MNIIGRLLLFAGIALTPVYAFSSGGMQISHALISVFLFFFVAFRGIRRGAIEQVLLALLIFVFLREAFDVFQGSSLHALLPVAYLLFNISLMNVLRRVALDEDGIRAIKWGITAAAIVAVSGVLMIGYRLTIDDEGGRAIGTFNNPNQLGYFSVCLLTIALLLRLTGHVSLRLLTFLSLGAVFLAIASLSKAAMISVALAMLFAGFTFMPRRSFLVGVISISILVVGAYALYSSGALDQYSFIRRLQDIGQAGDDSLEARGYFAIADSSALEVLFGLGSTKAREIIGHEIHSTIFSYVGNYGAVGGGLMIAALVLWGKTVYQGLGWRGLMLVVVPPMLYGISHNGSRFTVFWLLLATSTGLCANLASARRRNMPSLGSEAPAHEGLRPLQGARPR